MLPCGVFEGDVRVRKPLVVIGLMLALAGAAAAQAPKPSPKPTAKPGLAPKSSFQPMSIADAKRELFGVDLSGGMEGDPKYRWRECIDPKGLTLYQHDGIEEHGLLEIDASGQACFSYPPGNKDRISCFSAGKTAVGYDFRGFGVKFHATSARRVQTCDNQNVSDAGRPGLFAMLESLRHGG
jgi:hypothetical protein